MFSGQCVLCNAEKHANPCLIDLSTGEIGELPIYDVGLPSESGTAETEFRKEQPFGTFSFVKCAGANGYKTTGTYNKCSFTLPVKSKHIQRALYCKDCYELLSSVSKKGYLLLDLYDLENIQVYSIESGDVHSVRCFEISVIWDAKNNDTNVDVCGTLEIMDGEHGVGMIVNYP